MHSEVDFKQDGKHTGYIRLPHSVHRSAYGWLPIPVASIRNGSGPKIVLMAGNHGDEYEGQIILNELIRCIQPEQVSGQIIILPMANYPAAHAGCRVSPIDSLNLNREFPGDSHGSPTQKIAHYIETIVLKDANYFLDIHSGGTSLEYFPVVMFSQSDDNDNNRRVLEIVNILALPYSQEFNRDINGQFASSAAERNGALAFTIELGGGGQVNRQYRLMFEQSVLRLLNAIGLLSTTIATSDTRTKIVTSSSEQQIFARNEGLFEPLVELGSYVNAGDTVAMLHDPSTPGARPIEVVSSASGMVLCRRTLAQAKRGDCLFELVTNK